MEKPIAWLRSLSLVVKCVWLSTDSRAGRIVLHVMSAWLEVFFLFFFFNNMLDGRPSLLLRLDVQDKPRASLYSSAYFLPVYTSSSGIFLQIPEVLVLASALYTFFSKRSAWPSSLPDGFAFVYMQTSRTSKERKMG